jgi:hypothetical protein
MSAWIVSKKHIDLLVTAALSAKYMTPAGGDERQPSELGLMLWVENHKSVNSRYSETRMPEGYKFTRFPGKIDPIVVLKQIACYEYQSCEHDTWKTSEAFKFCQALTTEMINALPGYSEAPWGIGTILDD